jgi:hypothetical protein
VLFVFGPYQQGAGGHWSAACQHPGCLWTYDTAWNPCGDGTELAALSLAAAEHERDPHRDGDQEQV